MISLLLDSSDKFLTVGLSKDNQILKVIRYEAWQKQSEYMITEIENLIKDTGIALNLVDNVISCKGPGSYTGVRIALTIAKVFAYCLNRPLYLVSSLEALRKENKKSICLMNARSKRSYVGIYDENGKAILEDCIKDNSEVFELIESHKDYEVCGDVSYLGIDGYRGDVASILMISANEDHLEKDIYGAKPIYLKDNYETGKFKVVVRKMITSDLDEIEKIENVCFKHPYTRSQLEYELLENPITHLYSAIVDNEIVGFIDFQITFNSSSISQIAVKEEFRRKGIANLLLGQMLKDLESQEDFVEFITLEVRKSNEVAQAFYKKHKFNLITTKHSYYDDGEDALYYVRNLVK